MQHSPHHLALVGSLAIVVFVLISAMAAPVPAQASLQPETDNTVTRIHVYPNGSAQWTIHIRTRLDTDQRVNEYNAFQARFQNDTARYLNPFKNRMQGVVATAANTTGRDMNATVFRASTHIQEVPRRWGVVTFSFRWTNFATTESGTIVVGDVFQGGFFLAANDTLKIETPAGYQIAEVAPPPDRQKSGVVTWVGQENFDDSQPHLRFTRKVEKTPPPKQETTLSPAPTQATAADNPQQPSQPRQELFLLAGGAILVTIIGLGAYLLISNREQIPMTGTPMEHGNNDTDTASTTPDDASPSGIVTDEEQVQNLLREYDGRMRQADIAEELDWSASKTSRVIARMVDEGSIEKLQLGRENVIDLQEAED